MLIHFYETTKFFANFFTKRHPLPPISFFHFMEWGIPPNPNCPFRKGPKGYVLLLFKKKRTEENSTFPKPLSTYKGDVIDSEGRPSPSTFWYGSQAFVPSGLTSSIPNATRQSLSELIFALAACGIRHVFLTQ